MLPFTLFYKIIILFLFFVQMLKAVAERSLGRRKAAEKKKTRKYRIRDDDEDELPPIAIDLESQAEPQEDGELSDGESHYFPHFSLIILWDFIM